MPGNGDKIMLDALVSISKSLSRIADELKMIRESVLYDHREKLRESREAKFRKSGILTESDGGKTRNDDVLSRKGALENIHDILGGKYVG